MKSSIDNYVELGNQQEETIVEVLDINIKVKTDMGNEKIIHLTKTKSPQNVELFQSNDEVRLIIKFNKE